MPPTNSMLRYFVTPESDVFVDRGRKIRPLSIHSPVHSPPQSPARIPSMGKGKGKVAEDILPPSVCGSSQGDSILEGPGESSRPPQSESNLTCRVDIDLLLSSKRKRAYEFNRHFQDSWAAKLPWAEPVYGEDGRICQVRCAVCTKIEGREKLLVPKIDSLWKHAGRRKAVANIGDSVKRGDFYFLSGNSHVKNEKLFFAALGRESVVQQVSRSSTVERKKKLVQFTLLFHLLSLGRPMTDFEQSQSLLQQLHVPDIPKKHWSDTSGWEMAESMSEIVNQHSKDLLKVASYVSISTDEVTSIDNQSWLSVHVYVVRRWTRFPILLALQRVVGGCTAEHLTTVITDTVKSWGDMSVEELARKTMSFGADGAPVFQGVKTGVVTRIQEEHAPYCIPIHCVAHRTSLAVDTLSKLPLVSKLEHLCTILHSYFSHSPKRHLEFTKLAETLDTEGLKILKNVKSRWISILEPLQRILGEYKTLVVKMHQDFALQAARTNYNLLTDFETLISLPCIMPLLMSVNCLIKFAQARDVFICDFIRAVKLCQEDLYRLYLDPDTAFKKSEFQSFCDLVDDHSHTMTHEWSTDVNTSLEYLQYRIGDHRYETHWLNDITGKEEPVGRMEFLRVVNQVKKQCRDAAEQLIEKLDQQFPESDLMNALGVVFPQYWQRPDADRRFPLDMAIIKGYFCATKSLWRGTENARQVEEPLNAQTLEMQQGLFKMTIRSHSEAAMGEPLEQNPMTKLWQKLSVNSLLTQRMSEWFKLAEIAIVTVIGSVEDERTFSTVSFIKNKVRNRLTDHLDCTIKLFAQNYWKSDTFPYQSAITHWMDTKDRLGAQF